MGSLTLQRRQTATTESTIHYTPTISRDGMAVLIWLALALCFLFVALRTVVQYRHNKRFYTNDYLIFFALFCHVGSAITCQYVIPPMYELERTKRILAVGGIPEANIVQRAELYLRCQFALLILLWTTLWSVKFSLLFFFWRLFDSIRTKVRIFWYIMCFVTGATYITTIFLQLFACRSPGRFFHFGATGCSTKRDLYLSNVVFLFSAGTDIAVDVLLLFIPFPLLWKLQVDQRQKTILVILFLLPTIPIMFGVLRLVFVNPADGTVNVVKFQMYSMLENTAAIVTACLPSLRLYINNSRNNTKASSTPAYYGANTTGLSNKPKSFADPPKGAIPLDTILEAHNGEVRSYADPYSKAYGQAPPSRGVVVTKEYSVTKSGDW